MNNRTRLALYFLRKLKLVDATQWPSLNTSDEDLKEALRMSGLKVEKKHLHSFFQFEDKLRQNKIEFICKQETSRYPKAWQGIATAPPILFYQGSLECLNDDQLILGIVGSRNPISNSVEWMEENIKELLSRVSVVVASGAAAGVDQIAHRLALRDRTRTIAVLPSGFFNLYPHSFVPLANEIRQSGGLLLSAFAPFEAIRKQNFIYRNLLLAHLTKLLVVVQAARRSGSMSSGRYALLAGNPVFSLPFCPTFAGGLGSLDLIADGAFLLRDTKDLLAAIELLKTKSSAVTAGLADLPST